MSSKLSLAIDASRNRSGGAIAHMIGLLGAADPGRFGFSKVHVWSYGALLQALPDRSWLIRHNPPELEEGIFSQLRWQRTRFAEEVRGAGCQIVLNTDAGTVSRFRPAVTMSRDMLSYEPGEIERYGWSKARLRLWLLRHMQNRSLRAADGVVFLTHYASRVIQAACGALPNVAIIHHGVREDVRGVKERSEWPIACQRDIRCVYVSNAAPYKHQWSVVRAIEDLRHQGYAIALELVGGGHGHAQTRLEAQIGVSDPDRRFVSQRPFVPAVELAPILREADLFVFASSCENMPNTLLEGMAAGLPIACSDRGPMPEVLRDGGVYFDPEDYRSIATAIRLIVDDERLRQRISERAQFLANEFSWQRCAEETFVFLAETHNKWTT